MLEQMKNVYLDTIIPYKNFLHWNISKILINLSSLGLGLLLMFPFLLLLGLSFYFDNISWMEVISNYYASGSLGLSVISQFYEHLFVIIFEFFLIVIWALAFTMGYSYKNLLFSNLYLQYIDGQKLSYTENVYFNWEKIFTYVKMMVLIGLILLIPVVVLVILFFIYVFAFWGMDVVLAEVQSVASNYFSLLLWVTAFICFLAFLYLAYRLSFSYMIMMDSKNYSEKKWASFYIKESFAVSKWVKIFKFILFLIIFTLIMLPFDYIGNYVENNLASMILPYSVILFIALGNIFDMYIISVYRRIMIGDANHEEKIQETKQEEIVV